MRAHDFEPWFDKEIDNFDKVRQLRDGDYDDFLRRNYFQQFNPPQIIANAKWDRMQTVVPL